MKTDTSKFLETLLFCMESEDRPELDGKTIYDFSPAFVAAVDGFISGFESFLESKGFDLDRLNDLQRSFGGNVYASLSGHGIGFFDEYGDESKTLGDELQKLIQEYSGDAYRFEQIELCEDENGNLDLAFKPEYLEEQRTKLFSV